MTEEDRSLLNDLKKNTRLLFQEFEKLELEVNQLENKVQDMKSEIESLEREKLNLSQKNEQLKIAAHLLSGVDENREARKKIDKLVREIDKCIALLNK